MKHYSLFLMFMLLLVSCKTKDYTPYDYDGEILVFGTGGGFSGKVSQYTLMSNGQFYRGTHKEGKVFELPKIEKRKVKQLFDSYHNLGFADVSLNESANMYKFFEMHRGDKKHKIMYGNTGESVANEIKIYFSNLMALARNANSLTQSDKTKSADR